MLSISMPEMDQFLKALILLALLLYFTPAVSSFKISADGRRWFQLFSRSEQL
jgi:hypothetical protein